MKYKKIPIPLVFLLIVIILVGGFFLIDKLRSLNTGAATETSPKQVRITNIGSSSFVVSWITQEKATGLIHFGETTSLGEMKKDLRDKNNSASEKFQTHYVTVDNLKPETKYYFKIISSGASYDNSKKLFEVTTGLLKVPKDNDIAQGKIINSNKEPVEGAIVYLSIANAITQSAISDKEGHWMIPLSTARDLDLKNFSNYDRNAQVEEIFVQGDFETASASLTTANDNPTPDIILGQQDQNFLNALPSATSTPPPTRKQTFASSLNPQTTPGSDSPPDNGEKTEVSIVFPSEKEEVNSQKPEFLGTGPNGQILKIQIESNEAISSETKTDQKGKWKYSPETPLSPGAHKITVFYTDKDGFIKKAVRSFTVLATGSSDLPSYTATPSGQTTTPTPKVSIVPTPSSKTPTISITTTPSLTITPTSTASAKLSPTATPTKQYRSTVPSTESGTYRSGTTLPTQLFFGVGLITLIIGAVLILF